MAGETEYGVRLCSVIARGNLVATQFHPEKSGEIGLKLYDNFIRLALENERQDIMAKIEKVKYLIIGNSAGGIGAAEAIREVDGAGRIAIVSDEPYPAYSRPLISEYLATRCPLEKMLFRPADFYEKNRIQTILGQKGRAT